MHFSLGDLARWQKKQEMEQAPQADYPNHLSKNANSLRCESKAAKLHKSACPKRGLTQAWRDTRMRHPTEIASQAPFL
jgi:hypothetical protein